MEVFLGGGGSSYTSIPRGPGPPAPLTAGGCQSGTGSVKPLHEDVVVDVLEVCGVVGEGVAVVVAASSESCLFEDPRHCTFSRMSRVKRKLLSEMVETALFFLTSTPLFFPQIRFRI